jgi:NAD-dependent deacetylase
MKKIVVFTGAGISAESGVATFRDTVNGLWYNYNIDEVATLEGWLKDRKKVLDFHNLVRSKLSDSQPNKAHLAICKLEEKFDVTIITQNIDDLHERAGSSKIFHLHGELLKSRSSKNPRIIYDCKGDINVGDKCELGSQLRPHTVLFGEYPFNIDKSYKAILECDYLLIIGTSLQISYTHDMLLSINDNAKIYYIDPSPSRDLDYRIPITYIEKTAVAGVTELVDKLMNETV